MHPLTEIRKLLPPPQNTKEHPRGEAENNQLHQPPNGTVQPRQSAQNSQPLPNPQGGKGNRNNNPQDQEPSTKNMEEQKQVQERQRTYREKNRKIIVNKGYREAILGHEEGLQTLIISPINPDNFTGKETKFDITHQLDPRRIRTAEIRDTQIPRNRPYKKNGCKIIATAAMAETGTIRNEHAIGSPQGGA